MTYTITQKLQQAIPPIFGGGVRYRFVLSVLYPFGRTIRIGGQDYTSGPEVDSITPDLTVDKQTFYSFEIGHRISVGLSGVDTQEAPVKSDV